MSEGPRRRSGRLRSHGVSERPNSSSSSSDDGEDKKGGSETDKSSESEASGKFYTCIVILSRLKRYAPSELQINTTVLE